MWSGSLFHMWGALIKNWHEIALVGPHRVPVWSPYQQKYIDAVQKRAAAGSTHALLLAFLLQEYVSISSKWGLLVGHFSDIISPVYLLMYFDSQVCVHSRGTLFRSCRVFFLLVMHIILHLDMLSESCHFCVQVNRLFRSAWREAQSWCEDISLKMAQSSAKRRVCEERPLSMSLM